MSIESALYECTVWHSREKPRKHVFRHNHFMFYLCLEEMEVLEKRLKLFSGRRSTLYRFDQHDHLPGLLPANCLQDRVRAFLRSSGIGAPVTKIHLLTNVRMAGYVFNPVSFFFCFSNSEEVSCCVVEVGNTFGEKKAYLLRPDGEGNLFDRQPKEFYVSPFTELRQFFNFKITRPGNNLDIKIDTVREDQPEPVVLSGMSGKRFPLSDEQLLRLTLAYPFAPMRVISLIHFHAMLLWLKRVPHRRKEEFVDLQTSVMNPHKSLRYTKESNS